MVVLSGPSLQRPEKINTVSECSSDGVQGTLAVLRGALLAHRYMTEANNGLGDAAN